MPHESLVFIPPTASISDSASRRAKIQYKANWADSWTDLDHARIDMAAWSCAPSYPRASFRIRHGYGIQPGETIPQNYPWVDLTRKWVRIELPDLSTASDPAWVWIGVSDIVGKSIEDTITVGGTAYPMGESEYVCYGVERLLDSHLIQSSLWYDTAERTSDVGLVFNRDGKPNRSASQRSANNHYYFASSNEDPSYWSTKDIIEYMVRSEKGMPGDETGSIELGFSVDSADLNKLPDWDAPELETHLVSAHQIISALVNRRRLYTWWLEVDESVSPAVVKFRVATFTGSSIDIGNGNSIPANDDSVDMQFNDDSTMLARRIDRSVEVDQVIAYGSRRLHVCTTTFGASSSHEWDRGWTSSEVTDYQDAGTSDPGYPSDIDAQQRWVRDARNREEHNHVFSRFVLRDTIPYPPSDPDSYVMFYDNVRVQPDLPLLANVDYSGNAIDSKSFVFRGNGPWPPRPLMAYIKVPGTSRYVKLSDIGSSRDVEVTDSDAVRNWHASVRVPSDGKSLIVDVAGGPQHIIGSQDFTPLANVDEDVYGDWDWEEMKATVAFLDERYAEGKYPADAAVTSTDATRVMRIPAGPQYRQDYVVENTVVDIDDDGTEVLATNDGYLQDDRPKLESLARMAYQWYGNPRHIAHVEGTYNTPVEKLALGKYVTQIQRQGSSVESVDSVITQFSVEFYHNVSESIQSLVRPVKFTCQTSFGELDLVRLGVLQR